LTPAASDRDNKVCVYSRQPTSVSDTPVKHLVYFHVQTRTDEPSIVRGISKLSISSPKNQLGCLNLSHLPTLPPPVTAKQRIGDNSKKLARGRDR